jgi:putative transposase
MKRGRRALVEREPSAPPLSRQCQLLSVLRTSIYRRSAPVSAEDGTIHGVAGTSRTPAPRSCVVRSLIVYLPRPYYGSLRVRAWLVIQGGVVNGNRVQRALRLAGLAATYRPDTSKPAPAKNLPLRARRRRRGSMPTSAYLTSLFRKAAADGAFRNFPFYTERTAATQRRLPPELVTRLFYPTHCPISAGFWPPIPRS